MKTILEALEPLEELTNVLCGEEHVTASAILPIVYLIEKLQGSQECEGEIQNNSDDYDDGTGFESADDSGAGSINQVTI